MYGIIFLGVSCFIRSGFYVASEAVLKKDLEFISKSEKQVVIGLFDCFGYLLCVWIEIVVLQYPSWNPFQNIFSHWQYSVIVGVSAFQNGTFTYVLESFSAMALTLLNVLVALSTWLVEMGIEALDIRPRKVINQFTPVHIPIFLILFIGVALYQILKTEEDAIKAKREEEKMRTISFSIQTSKELIDLERGMMTLDSFSETMRKSIKELRLSR
jgi:uncharacterized metal-binding protein